MATIEKSKLEIITNDLASRPDVYVAGQIDDTPCSSWASFITIITAPIYPEFKPDKLNEFMYGLTNLTPSQSDRAWQPKPDADLEIGKIYFDQVIGTQYVQTITRIDPVLPQALEEAGIKTGETSNNHTIDLQRRVIVSVYPDPSTAQAIYEYKKAAADNTLTQSDYRISEYRLTPQQLDAIKAQYTSSPLAKLRQLISH